MPHTGTEDSVAVTAGRPAALVNDAGLAGLAAASALTPRGLPDDHVGRHTCVGGIWDIEALDSRVHKAVHFVSSKSTSAFTGYAMGDDLPDYRVLWAVVEVDGQQRPTC
jgi:hypothetical protein